MARTKGRGRSAGQSKANKQPSANSPAPVAEPAKDLKKDVPVKSDFRELGVEIDSPIEGFLTLTVLFHGTFSALVSLGMYMAFTNFLPEKAMTGFYLICGIHGLALLFLVILKFSFKCSYIVSEKKRVIDKIVRLGPIEFRDLFLKFEDIEVVTATGIRKQTTRHPIDKWYSYTVCLLEKSGKAYEFSRESKNLAGQQDLAAKISELTECKKMTCEKENVVKVQKVEGRVIVELVHLPIRDFSGDVLPFEAEKQKKNVPVILGSFFLSFILVFAGTAFLFMILGNI